jgi:hypothetical protein
MTSLVFSRLQTKVLMAKGNNRYNYGG